MASVFPKPIFLDCPTPVDILYPATGIIPSNICAKGGALLTIDNADFPPGSGLNGEAYSTLPVYLPKLFLGNSAGDNIVQIQPAASPTIATGEGFEIVMRDDPAVGKYTHHMNSNGTLIFSCTDTGNYIISPKTPAPYINPDIGGPAAANRWGTLYCASLNASSSARVKRNIRPLITEEHPDLLQLKPATYKRQGETTKSIGLILEDVQRLFPGYCLSGTSGVAYTELIALLAATIKSLEKRIKLLSNKKGA